MQNFSKIFLQMIKKRVFLIAFGSSLAAGLLFFLILTLAFGGGKEPVNEKAFTAYKDLGGDFKLSAFNNANGDDTDEEEPDNLPRSILTGLPIDEERANRRPLAIVINNIRQALPQSGITSADIIYEVLAEGDVTRLIGIFQSSLPDKIGSIRSARDYFINMAYNHDAIFIHHGGSPAAYSHITNTRITNMDGGRLENRGTFWRDSSFPDWYTINTGVRASEHSAYTGRSQIEAHIESEGIRFTIGENPAFGFAFRETPDVLANLGRAHRVVVPFSPNYTRTFIYNEEENIYTAYNRDGEHLDADTREPVTVSNILIQFTRMNIIPGDEAGRRNVTTVGEGTGFLINNGVHYPVTWRKTAHDSPTQWFMFDEPLILTPGRTWICVFQTNGNATFE